MALLSGERQVAPSLDGIRRDHTARYDWAAARVGRESVLDVACGIGYGAEVLAPTGCDYLGVDLPGVPSATFAAFGKFLEVDVDDWDGPEAPFDVAVCFETLEHVGDPQHLADILSRARRLVLVSVPTVPSVHLNPWHRHDFEVDDIPALFASLKLLDVIPQPEERSHVWAFGR